MESATCPFCRKMFLYSIALQEDDFSEDLVDCPSCLREFDPYEKRPSISPSEDAGLDELVDDE